MRAPFKGPLQLQVDGQTHFLGHELAGTLRVCSEDEYQLVLTGATFPGDSTHLYAS